MLTTLYLVFTTLILSDVYDGPASIHYFKTSFNQSAHDLPEIVCDGYDFGNTTELNPVSYYKLTITSEMKQKYSGEIYLSTCCDQEYCDSWVASLDKNDLNNRSITASRETCNEYQINQKYNETEGGSGNISVSEAFCSADNSLDTLIYIFQHKRYRVNFFAVDDDSDCSNTQKSRIELSDYEEAEYIVGVGGYAKDYGNYYIQLQCIEYSFPIPDEQLDPPTDLTNVSSITCDKAINGTIDIETNPVDYYLLNITKFTYLPANLSTSNLQAIIYIFKEVQEGNYEIIDFDLYYGNLTLSNLGKGIYWILIQGKVGSNAQYLLTMHCSPAPTTSPTIEPTLNPTLQPSISPTQSPVEPPKISYDLMVGLVFGSAGCLLFLIIGFYIYEWIKYLKNKPHDQVFSSRSLVESYEEVDQNDQTADVVELAGTKQQLSVAPTDAADDDEVAERNEFEFNTGGRAFSDLRNSQMNVAGINIRQLDIGRDLHEQMDKDEDVIQRVLSHAIHCCKEEEKFDMYQVLAIRYYHQRSHEIRGFSPLTEFGINIEMIHFSPFIQTSFVAFVIGLTQTWGISVVVYKLIYAYFEDDNYSLACDMHESRWEEVFSLKILAFLLSLIVTFFISVYMGGIKHNGLYAMMEELELQHIKRVHGHIAIWIVQIGQAINYYVCLMSILGSYFIIFSSNQGEEQDDGSLDYSSAGLDMILNALALFFLLEVDDMLVTDEDYEVCGGHLSSFLETYKANPRINQAYSPKSSGNLVDDHEASDSFIHDIVSTMNRCSSCMTTFMYYFINVFSVFVTICCYGGGFAAPFVILFCW